MASLSHSESRRRYSWWWDSHISPKNSKWLQENLTDMDAKVKSMIKLIEEDADSFARRAEMYYKKRPELMKLVEEFYRAYRALAERYDHATVELRHAHRTIEEAFPNQVPFSMADSPSGSLGPQGEPQTPDTPHQTHEDENGLSSTFGGENEVEMLKKILTELQAEKEAVLLKYQQSMEKLLSLEMEIKDAGGLDERASRAEIEIKILKETLSKLEAERVAGLHQYHMCLERISSLENMLAQEKDTRGLNDLATKAVAETQNLKQELSRLEAEKEVALSQYNQCLKTISSLENKVSLMEENSRILKKQTERAENEVQALTEALYKLNEEKEHVEVQYENCLQRLTEMETEMSHARGDIERLNTEVLAGLANLKGMEKQCFQLRSSNQSLQLEANNLKEKIAIKDLELIVKEHEIEKLQSLLQEEQSQFAQIESTLQALQTLHAKSQEEQTNLAVELHNGLQMLRGLEKGIQNLHGDLQRVLEENESLNELKNSSSISIMSLQNEISSLKEMKGKLEEIVLRQLSQNDSLQNKVYHLKEEIGGLSRRYQALLLQVQAVGLEPQFLGSAVGDLQHENLNLKELCKKDREEMEALREKMVDINKLSHKNVDLERSLFELSMKLEASREKVGELQESCHSLQGEKSSLVTEKTTLLAQLQIMTENMKKLLEKNASLESSIFGANVEIEHLRTMLKSFEQLSQTLENEKFNLVIERTTLVPRLESAEQRLQNLEVRSVRLEEKRSCLEKEKDSTACLIKEMHSSYFRVEKQELAWNIKSNESRLAVLENQINLLQEERRLGKREFEEEVDKTVDAQVEVFVSQKIIEDLEEKYLCLLLECQKHIEASKLADKFISELETENLKQNVEVEFLSDEIEKSRMMFHQVFKILQIDPLKTHEDGTYEEQIPFRQVLDGIMDLRNSVFKFDDEKQQMMVENMVILTFLEELKLVTVENDYAKKFLDQEINMVKEHSNVLEKDKLEFINENDELKLGLGKGKQQEEVLKTAIETQHVSLLNLQGNCLALKEENIKVIGENRSLLQKIFSLEEKLDRLEEENSSILQEVMSLGNCTSFFESTHREKAEELKSLLLNVNHLHATNSDFRKKVSVLGEALELKEGEIQRLNQIIGSIKQEIDEIEDLTDQLNYENLIGKDFLRQKAIELLQAEEQIKVMDKLNAGFLVTIEKLEAECEESRRMKERSEKQILELFNNSVNQQTEIECLQEANENLKTEVDILSKKVEEQSIREEDLNLELQERSNEFELWEAEASSFYFDLQISSINEVLLENKVQELSTACKGFEDEKFRKDSEIEQMKERFFLLESEVGELQAQLSAYTPAIASLRESVESFEKNALIWTSSLAARNQGEVADMGSQYHKTSHKQFKDDECPKVMDGISDLHMLIARMQSVEKIVVKEIGRLAAKSTIMDRSDSAGMQRKINSGVKMVALINGAEQLDHTQGTKLENVHTTNARVLKDKADASEVRNGISMKDIPLDEYSGSLSPSRSKKDNSADDDHMLELWVSTEQDCNFDPITDGSRTKSASARKCLGSSYQLEEAEKTPSASPELHIEKDVSIDKLEVSTSIKKESYYGESRGKLLERLDSDAKKLMSLQTIILELKKAMEMKNKNKKGSSFEFERAKSQLKEVEANIVQLVHANYQWTRDIEETPSVVVGGIASLSSEESVNVQIKTVAEQVQKGSEKIILLQFELESIHYILLKLKDEKKSKGKVKVKFSASKTGTLFRDFIHIGHRSNRRRKKTCLCGCARPSAKED